MVKKMKVLVINGSPKGEYSVTLQTVKYLEILFKGHQFEVLHVGQKIRQYEKDFSPVIKAVKEADLLLFSYPVYTFAAPSQLHRFIELLKESGVSLEGKFVTQLTTSKHFYDITAHGYIRDNCQEVKMNYIHGLSADMDDLTTKKGQKEARDFFAYVEWCISHHLYETIKPEEKKKPLQPVSLPKKEKRQSEKEVVLITDLTQQQTQLKDMIQRFCSVMPAKIKIVNLREYPFKGGCIGCFHCAVDGTCIYQDGFDQYLRTEIQTADAIVYAFSIKDHSMGSLFKLYDDRQFCNGHRTVTMGIPVGYLVNGHYSHEVNLQMIIEGRAQVGGNFLAGVACDEINPDQEIDKMAARLFYGMKKKYVQPSNFYGVGGMKIFRDLIWLMQGMMKADHQFYKKHGQYDFPQKKAGTMLMMYFVGAMISSPKLKAKMGPTMNEGMLAPYKKVLKRAQQTRGKK